jgi:hypothetical protein
LRPVRRFCRRFIPAMTKRPYEQWSQDQLLF